MYSIGIIEFARTKGAKDKKKRSRAGTTLQGMGAINAATGAAMATKPGAKLYQRTLQGSMGLGARIAGADKAGAKSLAKELMGDLSPIVNRKNIRRLGAATALYGAGQAALGTYMNRRKNKQNKGV